MAAPRLQLPAWQSLSGARLALVTNHWSLHHIFHTPTSLVTTAKLQPTPATSGGAASIILRVGKYGLGWERLLARWPSSRRRDLGVALHPGNFFASKSRIFAFQVKNVLLDELLGSEISLRPLTCNIGGQLTLLTSRSAAIACDYGSPVLQEIIGSAQLEFEGLLKLKLYIQMRTWNRHHSLSNLVTKSLTRHI